MDIDRRKFLVMATAAMAATDCRLVAVEVGLAIDAGPVSNFASDGVYDAFREQGFFVVRKDGKLSAVSSVCTHKKTILTARRPCSFYCKRHGSVFDCGGHVLNGPATRDLPVLSTSVNAAGHLLVTLPG